METIWGMVGVIIGGVITWFVQWDDSRRSVATQKKIAEMQIASLIRRWFIDTGHVFDKESYNLPTEDMDPDRYVFPAPGDIPPFPFEDSLATISLLNITVAESLFDVIARRRDAENSYEHTSFLEDNERAAEIFEARIGEIFCKCETIYTELANQIKWNGMAISERQHNSMHEKAAKLNEIFKRPSENDLEKT